MFFKIVNDEVMIKLPNYVTRMEPQNISRVTRNSQAIASGSDKSTFKCNIAPKVKSFEDSFFYRTVQNWNDQGTS